MQKDAVLFYSVLFSEAMQKDSIADDAKEKERTLMFDHDEQRHTACNVKKFHN